MYVIFVLIGIIGFAVSINNVVIGFFDRNCAKQESEAEVDDNVVRRV